MFVSYCKVVNLVYEVDCLAFIVKIEIRTWFVVVCCKVKVSDNPFNEFCPEVGDYGCPWSILWTLTPYPLGIGSPPKDFHQVWNCVSSFIYSWTLGAGASTNVLEASISTTIFHKAVLSAYNILAHVWSRLAVYVSPKVTVPFIRDDPLHTPCAFLVLQPLTRYSQINGSVLTLFGNGADVPNIPWSSYWSSCLCSESNQSDQSSCFIFLFDSEFTSSYKAKIHVKCWPFSLTFASSSCINSCVSDWGPYLLRLSLCLHAFLLLVDFSLMGLPMVLLFILLGRQGGHLPIGLRRSGRSKSITWLWYQYMALLSVHPRRPCQSAEWQETFKHLTLGVDLCKGAYVWNHSPLRCAMGYVEWATPYLWISFRCLVPWSQLETITKPWNLSLLDSTTAVGVTMVPSYSLENRQSVMLRWPSLEYQGICTFLYIKWKLHLPQLIQWSMGRCTYSWKEDITFPVILVLAHVSLCIDSCIWNVGWPLLSMVGEIVVVADFVGVKLRCNDCWISEVAALIQDRVCVDSGVFHSPVLLRI